METKPQNRVERKKEETQNKVITVAVNLFNQHGLESVTMEQIADAVDIAKGTLYNYFPSKEAIINAYLQRTFQERNEDRIAQFRQLPDTHSRLVSIFTFLIEGVKRQKKIFEAFMVYRMKQVISLRAIEPEEQTGLSLLIREIIELGQCNHELRSDLPVELLEDLFEFALIQVIKPFYLQPERYDQERSIMQSVDIFMNGAKA